MVSLDDTARGIIPSQVATEWSVKGMSDEAKKAALPDRHQAAAVRHWMREGSSRDDIEDEAEWIESTPTRILDKPFNLIGVTAWFKRWWISEFEANRKEYGQTSRLYKQKRTNTFTLKAEQNSY